jgi:hypothetical protein
MNLLGDIDDIDDNIDDNITIVDQKSGWKTLIMTLHVLFE